MSGRAVVPIYDTDYQHMIGCSGRSVSDELKPKWKHNKGFSAENCLYNFWFAKKYIKESRTAIIVESPGNVWKLESNGIHNAVAIFGSNLNDKQKMLLDTSGAMTLVIITDSDDAGMKARTQIDNKCKKIYNIQHIHISKNDIAELSNEEIKRTNHIENKYMTKIISFAGRKQSGKTTCSEFVSKQFVGDVKVYNFADPLKKDICINILGLTYDQCYGTDEQKNELVNCVWNNQQLTAREVMQFIGTDIFRTMQQGVWTNATINKILKEKPDMAIVADCRFPNEVQAIKNVGGIVIKLTRNPFNSNHDSETALDNDRYDQNNFDLIIDNKLISINDQNLILNEFLSSKGILPL
jgi:DNA primase